MAIRMMAHRLPGTYGGEAVKLVVFLSVALTGIVSTRRRREWLVLSAGITLPGLRLSGVRAVH